MKILYLPLEFERYESVKKWPYPLGVGLVEGFLSNGVDVTTIPMFYGNNLWLKFIPELVAGISFDQVWIEVVHSVVPVEVMTLLAKLAPIRVGLICESLTIHQDEWVANYAGTKRRVDNLNTKGPFLTHMLVTDVRDVHAFSLPTLQQVAHVPNWFLQKPRPYTDVVDFVGTLYGNRGSWMQPLIDEGLLNVNQQAPLDHQSGFPLQYENLVLGMQRELPGKTHLPLGYYRWFMQEWLRIRQRLYEIWRDQLTHLHGFGLLNPPHRTEVLSSRVVEGMAIGKVMFTPRLGTATDRLFLDRCHWILYNDIEELRSCILQFRQHPEVIEYVGRSAEEAISQSLTTTKWVTAALTWIKETVDGTQSA